jgi:glucosamine-6-phosphate deaminase
VLGLLDALQRDHLFVAGDLSDPHGTHRMCYQAIDRALRLYERAVRDRGRPRRPASAGVALSRRVAGVGDRPRRRVPAALEGRAGPQDGGHPQAREPEGPRALRGSPAPTTTASSGSARATATWRPPRRWRRWACRRSTPSRRS